MKKKKTKIAFLGESVASGFLISPYFTPAGCLQSMFDSCCEASVTVMDRSKVSIRIDELTEILQEDEVLHSDMVVIFAGNNWRKDLWNLEGDAWSEIISRIKTGERWEQDFIELFQSWMEEKSKKFYEVIRRRFLACNIPVLFVIPEFNLRDWSYGSYEKVINCPGPEYEREWQLLQQLGEYSFESEQGKELAQGMLSAMPSNPAVMYWLARHHDIKGEYQCAFEYYCQALDTNIFRLGPPPGINRYIRENILHHSRQEGFHVLDLRQSFHDLENGVIAGKDLFFDYCHLNVEGIKTACRVIFEKTIEILHFKKISDSFTISVSQKAESNGYFFAAIHTFHVGNGDREYIKFLLQQAIAKDKGIIDKIYHYCIFASQKIPWYLNHHYLENNVDQYPMVRQHKDCMVMDKELVDCMTDVLEDFGVSIRDEVRRERLKEHALVSGHTVNLLETYYMESSYFNIFLGSRSRSFDHCPLAYKRFRDRSTYFHFLSRYSTVKCTITLRLPDSRRGMVKIFCNGVLVTQLKVSNHWSTVQFEVTQLYVDGKINRLEIIWDAEVSMAGISSKNILDYLRPVFGEIFTFQIEGKGEYEDLYVS